MIEDNRLKQINPLKAIEVTELIKTSAKKRGANTKRLFNQWAGLSNLIIEIKIFSAPHYNLKLCKILVHLQGLKYQTCLFDMNFV